MKNEAFLSVATLSKSDPLDQAAAAMTGRTKRCLQRVWMLLCAAFFILPSSCLVSCSEEDSEAGEWDNWQARNDMFFATLDDSLSSVDYPWQRILNYSLSSAVSHEPTEYIYVKKIKQGAGTDSPMLTDSVRVSYQGRLLPSKSYPQGYVFDSSAYSDYDDATNATLKFVMVTSGNEAVIPGWITALLNMHRGDHWRIYIPYALGYKGKAQVNSSGDVTIPAYSTLIFDLTLVDFSPVGEVMPPYKAPRK